MKCSSCGAKASGQFCAQCGAPLSGEARRCLKCGGQLKPGVMFCSDCGEPTGSRQRKPFSAHLPWVLSFVALAAFSLAIAFFVQRQSRARAGDDPITGGLPELQSGVGGPVGGTGGMPDLASMSPREAADRLFERSMREEESGNQEQASMFANMALQAYGQVPSDQIDLDALFHVGLLHLSIGDANTARTIADGILEDDENDLLALLLGGRAAASGGDQAPADGYATRLRAALEVGLLDQDGRPEYQAHRELIEKEAAAARETGESAPAEDGPS